MNPPAIVFPNLGIEIANLNRVALSVFGFQIYWYALFIIAGLMAGYFTASIEAKRTGQNVELYKDILFVGGISAFIGLRLFYVIFNWQVYSRNPIAIITGIREGGLAIIGGIIATIIATVIFARVRKADLWTMFDTGMPSFALGQVIGRWGNFFNREAFGDYTNNLFAMGLPVGTRNATPLQLENTINVGGGEYFLAHPTFLYESLWNLVLFISLTVYRPRKAFKGEIFFLYLAGYGLGRALIEPLRTDQMTFGSLPINLFFSILMCVLGIGFIIYFRVTGKSL